MSTTRTLFYGGRITRSRGSGGPSEQFDTWAHLEIPGDLLPGEYELRLVVYDAETLKPTVELGVWEPERTLARLQVGEVR